MTTFTWLMILLAVAVVFGLAGLAGGALIWRRNAKDIEGVLGSFKGAPVDLTAKRPGA